MMEMSQVVDRLFHPTLRGRRNMRSVILGDVLNDVKVTIEKFDVVNSTPEVFTPHKL